MAAQRPMAMPVTSLPMYMQQSGSCAGQLCICTILPSFAWVLLISFLSDFVIMMCMMALHVTPKQGLMA